MRYIQALLRHIDPNSDIFRTLHNLCVYNHAIFRTLADLEPDPSSKGCETCKMIRHVQCPGIVKTVHSNIFKESQGYSVYLGIFRDIHAYSVQLTGVQLGESDAYSVTVTGVQLEGSRRGLPWPFLKVGKSILILEKKAPDCVHLWVKFLFKMWFWEYLGERTSICFPAGLFFLVFLQKFLFKCPSSTKVPLPWKIPGYMPALKHYSFCKTLHLKYSCLSMNGVQSHLHILTHTSIYLGMLSLHIQDFIWRVNCKPTLQ